jgi:hypothetical protein
MMDKKSFKELLKEFGGKHHFDVRDVPFDLVGDSSVGYPGIKTYEEFAEYMLDDLDVSQGADHVDALNKEVKEIWDQYQQEQHEGDQAEFVFEKKVYPVLGENK